MTTPVDSSRPVSSDSLEALRAISTELGAAEIAADAAALAGRVVEGLFYVACLGQFKRGKSTVINALVGTPLLPTGVVPVTSVITVVRHGEAAGARVLFADGQRQPVDPSMLAEYVTEEGNPGNAKRVRVVEVTAPSQLLASGMCLVDTPGLGSVFRQNTEITRAFLPHIDAALLVLGADPPISGEEAAVAGEIAREVPNVLVVLNKADRLSPGDVSEAGAFTRSALAPLLGTEMHLFTVSAIERLDGSATRDWPALETALGALAAESGANLVQAARERGQRRIARRLLREIDGQRDALTLPIAEAEARVAALRATIDDARRALSDLAFLLAAEQNGLENELERERSSFIEAALPTALAALDLSISGMNRTSREEIVRAAEKIAHDAVSGWLERIEPRAEELYARATDRFVALAREFLQRVNRSDDDLRLDQGFRTRRRFYFNDLWLLGRRPPGSGLIDLVLTDGQRRSRARRDARAHLRHLLESNSVLITNDVGERILESRRRLEREIRSILDLATASAERALERARESHEAGAAAVAARLAWLESASERVAALASSTG